MAIRYSVIFSCHQISSDQFSYLIITMVNAEVWLDICLEIYAVSFPLHYRHLMYQSCLKLTSGASSIFGTQLCSIVIYGVVFSIVFCDVRSFRCLSSRTSRPWTFVADIVGLYFWQVFIGSLLESLLYNLSRCLN